MIREQARVASIEGGRMHLQALSSGGCRACASSASCGTAKLGKLLPTVEHALVLPLQPERRVGDLIELELPESALLAAACLAYLPPLAGLLLGALAISPAGAALQPLGGVLGVIAGLALSRILGRRSSSRLAPRPIGQCCGPSNNFDLQEATNDSYRA